LNISFTFVNHILLFTGACDVTGSNCLHRCAFLGYEKVMKRLLYTLWGKLTALWEANSQKKPPIIAFIFLIFLAFISLLGFFLFLKLSDNFSCYLKGGQNASAEWLRS
jgi:hypothetical protein